MSLENSVKNFFQKMCLPIGNGSGKPRILENYRALSNHVTKKCMETRRQDYNQANGKRLESYLQGKRTRFCEDLDREDEKGNQFRVAKQLVNRNRDVVGANCVKDSDGKIVMKEDRLMEVWRTDYDVL